MKNHRLLNYLLLVCIPLVALRLSALAADAPAQDTTGKAAAAPAATNPADDKAKTAPSPSNTHVLRPGDWIKVTVLDDARANHDYKIAPDGTIVPLFLDQPINLAGQTIVAGGQALEKAYLDGQIFVHPKVAIVLNQSASPEGHINVAGSVNHPHQVVIAPGETATLLSVITACGGPQAIAARTVTITRKLPDGKTMTFKADLKDAYNDAKKDIPLQDGDSVYLPQDNFGGMWNDGF